MLCFRGLSQTWSSCGKVSSYTNAESVISTRVLLNHNLMYVVIGMFDFE